MKPRISASAAEAYQRISALKNNTTVKVGERAAMFLGMTGYLITLKVEGEKRITYLRVGDPKIEAITSESFR